MDTPNLFSVDNGINRIKTFLIGGTDGQTYGINEWYLKKIELNAPVNGKCIVSGKDECVNPDIEYYIYDFGAIESDWDNIIGFKYHKIDDPELDFIAHVIDERLCAFAEHVMLNPEKYFKCVSKKKPVYYWECNSDDGYFESSIKDHHKTFATQEECYEDMRQHAVNKILWNTEWDDVLDRPDVEADKDGIIRYDSAIGYEINFYTDRIVHNSYSGTYIYEIHRKEED